MSNEPESEPALEQYRINVELRQTEHGEDEKEYKAVWRGATGYGNTVPNALRELATKIESFEQ